MPKLIKVYLQQIAIGFALSAVFTVILVVMNVGNLGHLVLHSADGYLGAFLIFFFNGLVFAAVQFGIKIMSMGSNDDDDDEPRGGLKIGARNMIPVRIETQDPRAQHQRRR
jgi:hypothetical protein